MAPKPTIIIFTVNYEPWISGAELFVKEVVARLRSDYHFVIITARQTRSVPRQEARDGVEIVRVGLGARFDKWFYPLLAPLAAWRRPHVLVHAVMESYAGMALWVYKIVIGLMGPISPTMLTLQSGDLDDKAAAGTIPAWLWKRIHTAPDQVTAISHFLAERAARLRRSAQGVSVIPNGVDLELVRRIKDEIPCPPGWTRDNKHLRIICVARLSPEKGLEYLFHAMRAVRARVPEATLTMVGGGALEHSLQTLARELGIESCVNFLGNQPHHEVIREILKSDVFICPSLAEGLGIVFLEAQACGVPVVGTRVGGIPDVIQDGVTGFLVPPRDSAAIANALARLLLDPGLRTQLGEAALQRIGRYSWDGIAEEVGALYQRLLRPDSVGTRNGIEEKNHREGVPQAGRPKRSLKIVFAAGLYPPAVGGPATVARDLVERFHGIGHGTVVVTYGRGDEKDLREADGVIRVEQGGGRIGRYLRYGLAVARAARGADAMLAFDAVGSGVPAALASVFLRKPLVIRVGGDYFWETASEKSREVFTFKQYWERGPSWRSLSYFLIRFALARARAVIFNSEMLSRVYVQHGLVASEKVRVIPNACPRISTPYSLLPTPYSLLFAGRFINLKNIPRLLEAVRELRSQGIPTTLTLVGSGPEENALGPMVQSMGLHGAVRILPPQTKEKLRELIAQSAAVVIPSYSEISPQLAGEALALGAPVILTREHGLPREMREFLFEINPASTQDLVAKIRAIMSPVTRAEWERRLQVSYQSRSLEVVGAEYVRVLEGTKREERGGAGRRKVRQLVKHLVYGAAYLQSLWYRGPRVAILLYHDVGYNRLYLTVRPEALLSQIRALQSQGFEFLSLADLLSRLRSGGPPPARAVALTFDDGTRGQYEHAFRICKDEGVPATFFVTTGWIGGACEYRDGAAPAITGDQLREIAQNPLMSIEPHGVTHRHFTAIQDDEVRFELQESKRVLQEKLGIECRVFAYPSGKFGIAHESLVAKAGYEAAVTVEQDLVNGEKTNFMTLPRITVDSGLPISGLRAATVPWGIKIMRRFRV